MDGEFDQFLQYVAEEIIRWVFDVNTRERGRVVIRIIEEQGFEIQTTVLRIPPRFGFFSPGPSFLQGCEACCFARLATLTVVLPFLLGIAAWSGASRAILWWMVALPFATFTVAWIFFCVVRMPSLFRGVPAYLANIYLSYVASHQILGNGMGCNKLTNTEGGIPGGEWQLNR